MCLRASLAVERAGPVGCARVVLAKHRVVVGLARIRLAARAQSLLLRHRARRSKEAGGPAARCACAPASACQGDGPVPSAAHAASSRIFKQVVVVLTRISWHAARARLRRPLASGSVQMSDVAVRPNSVDCLILAAGLPDLVRRVMP